MKSYTEYERFTQEVYQQLSNYHHLGIKTVQHNIKLKGYSGCEHQIDVYWEYEKDGISHRVAIECKNYNKNVPKEKVCAFRGVLDDLDDVEGIMVSKKGYQQGAKEYANHYGISLKELREPDGGESIIGCFNISVHANIRSTSFKVDKQWADERNIKVPASYIPIVLADRIIRNGAGEVIYTLDSLEKQISDHHMDDYPYFFPFEDAYINSKYYGLLKIQEVMYDYKSTNQQTTLDIDADGFVKAILKDVFSDNTDFMVMR